MQSLMNRSTTQKSNRQHRREFAAGARDFDTRAGFGDRVAAQIAGAVLEIVRPGSEDVLVEIGAGTGEIGHHLAGASMRYVAIDASEQMLRGFVRNYAAGRDRLLVVADCDGRWPIADGCVRCVFASRALHLLDPHRLVAELSRVAADRFHLLIGRTQRDPEGFKERLRDRLHVALTDRGLTPPDGRSGTRERLDEWIAAGATPIAPVEAARWSITSQPADVLRAWRNKPELGGMSLSDDVRESVLAELENWASQEFGDSRQELEAVEAFMITGASFAR